MSTALETALGTVPQMPLNPAVDAVEPEVISAAVRTPPESALPLGLYAAVSNPLRAPVVEATPEVDEHARSTVLHNVVSNVVHTVGATVLRTTLHATLRLAAVTV